MAGTAVSELIFFITALLVSSTVALVLVDVIDRYAEDLEESSSVLKGDMQSRLSIINDPLNVQYDPDTGNLTYYLKNTGTGALSMTDIVVSANGTALSGDSITVKQLSGGTKWSSGSTVEVVFPVKGLTGSMDVQGWASTSGLNSAGASRGSAQDSFVFRVREV
jgi:archaellum component FlaG (FlaF/FlaG flagellin family)